jgi:demethylmenaquinone methyltransferase/2-methoxy-6-polyprenyl-1,4-benzoquinol methylase
MAKAATGATPTGTQDEQQASAWVQRMFAKIAPRYDLLNHLLSFNIDRAWRRVLLKRLESVLVRPDARVLDLCCGTGDVLLDFERVGRAQVLGADFCHPMLVGARKKAISKGKAAELIEADALSLPLADSSQDAVSIAFGFRNLADYARGLDELYRVLKPGGLLAILEFSHPPTLLVRTTYGFYSRAILPLIGGIVSGSREAYSYLPGSIAKFPRAGELAQMMGRARFEQTRYELLSGGIAALHLGEKGR